MIDKELEKSTLLFATELELLSLKYDFYLCADRAGTIKICNKDGEILRTLPTIRITNSEENYSHQYVTGFIQEWHHSADSFDFSINDNWYFVKTCNSDTEYELLHKIEDSIEAHKALKICYRNIPDSSQIAIINVEELEDKDKRNKVFSDIFRKFQKTHSGCFHFSDHIYARELFDLIIDELNLIDDKYIYSEDCAQINKTLSEIERNDNSYANNEGGWGFHDGAGIGINSENFL